ncbi:TetR/AcrR family transcriptional regulator [Amycolatopsis australiensis]|uniref:TetR/AcrR family transcriptional regulator n=1 Tax=Amycolatopsis australiensis TaxID=546364 RepID=UPI003CCC05F7
MAGKGEAADPGWEEDPPGGRSARVREAVHDAVVELHAAGEIDAAIPRIAERAGVNPTSVYRRWGSRDHLLLTALSAGPARDAGRSG